MKLCSATKQMTYSEIHLGEKIVFSQQNAIFALRPFMLGENTMYNIDTNHRHLPLNSIFLLNCTCVQIFEASEKK